MTDPNAKREALRRLRALGIAKPQDVTDAEWKDAGPYDSDDAKGMITSQLQERVRQSAERDLPPDDKGLVRHFFPQAVAVRAEIMNDPGAKASDRLKASETFIEHTIGKPDQVVEHRGSIAMQVFQQMTDLERRLTESGTLLEVKNKLAKVPDSVKEFLEKHMPEKHVVGRKGSTVVQGKVLPGSPLKEPGEEPGTDVQE